MEEPSRRTASLSIICRSCSDAIHVDLSELRSGEVAVCPDCGAERSLDEVDLPSGFAAEELRQELAGTRPPVSEDPQSGVVFSDS